MTWSYGPDIKFAWDDRRKLFVASIAVPAVGRPGHAVVVRRELANEARSPIDRAGAVLLLDALQREYASWLF